MLLLEVVLDTLLLCENEELPLFSKPVILDEGVLELETLLPAVLLLREDDGLLLLVELDVADDVGGPELEPLLLLIELDMRDDIDELELELLLLMELEVEYDVGELELELMLLLIELDVDTVLLLRLLDVAVEVDDTVEELLVALDA